MPEPRDGGAESGRDGGAESGRGATRRRSWWIAGLVIVVLVVVILAPLASSDPDGLESVAEQEGFIGAARDAAVRILPDYSLPGIDDPVLSTILAGLIGVGLVFLLMVGLGRLLRARRQPG